MAKQGEIDYLKRLGPDGIRHAANKPYSDANCGTYLMEIGVIMSLLPPPPARLLDAGCGTGWSSCFFAQRGYAVTGQDICPDMIYHANRNKARYGLENLHFVVSDYESLDYVEEFDCAVFLDALHHAVDEEAALRAVCRALRPGGVCITSEPGTGHEQSPHAVAAVARYAVTERDMPPPKIIRAARAAGFTRFRVYPHIGNLKAEVYGGPCGPLKKLKRLAHTVYQMTLFRRHAGIVVMSK